MKWDAKVLVKNFRELKRQVKITTRVGVRTINDVEAVLYATNISQWQDEGSQVAKLHSLVTQLEHERTIRVEAYRQLHDLFESENNDLRQAVKAIEAYVPSNNRSQMTRTDRNTLIVDAYNANPTSMAAALENFSNVSAPVKIAMLGDMLELGEDSLAEHVAVIKSVASRGLSMTFFVGKEFAAASEAVLQEGTLDLNTMQFFATSDQLAEHLAELQLSGATILIKGSRGTRMEKVISSL